MTGQAKLLLAVVVALGVATVVQFRPATVDRPDEAAAVTRRATTDEPPLSASIVEEPTDRRSMTSILAETPAMLFQACAMARLPAPHDAAARAVACSKALQSRQLNPDQIALARLTRGVARTLLGDRELAGDDYLDAVQRYDQLIDPTKPDALMLYRRATALDASGRTDRALEDYETAIKADPQSALAFLGRGILLADRKRAYERAIEDFNKVLILQPANVDALIARGDAFSNLGEAGRAMSDLNHAVALTPRREAAYLARGLAEARRGRTAMARLDYESTLRLDPRNVPALVNLAALDCLQANYESAIAHLDAAIAIDPRSAMAFYNRGFTRFALRQYDKAIADYDMAIRLEPRLGIAYSNRALARTIEGRNLVEALADSDQALKLQPLNLDVRDTRGFIYLKLGDAALALHEYNLALNADPRRALALYGRGLAKLRLGDAAGGQLDQAAAMAINPDVARDFSAYGL